MTTWTSDEINKIGTAEELELAPLRRNGTLRTPVTIWVVRLGERPLRLLLQGVRRLLVLWSTRNRAGGQRLGSGVCRLWAVSLLADTREHQAGGGFLSDRGQSANASGQERWVRRPQVIAYAEAV
jgi:hypothetical protein